MHLCEEQGLLKTQPSMPQSRWINKFFPADAYHNAVTSHFLSSRVLRIVRIVMAVIIGLFIFLAWVSYSSFVTYYTNLSYTLILLYFICSFTFCYDEKRPLPDHPIRARIGLVLFEISFVNALITTVAFWVLLFPSFHHLVMVKWNGWVYNIAAHAFNTAHVLFEIVISCHRFHPLHFVFPLAFGILYMFYAWLIFAFRGTWVYPFLDWSHAINALWYGVIVICVFLFFYAGFGLAVLRDVLLKKVRPGMRWKREMSALCEMHAAEEGRRQREMEAVEENQKVQGSPEDPNAEPSSPSPQVAIDAGATRDAAASRTQGQPANAAPEVEQKHAWAEE